MNLSDCFSCQSLFVAFEITESMWEFQAKLFVMSTPKYLYSEMVLSVCPSALNQKGKGISLVLWALLLTWRG